MCPATPLYVCVRVFVCVGSLHDRNGKKEEGGGRSNLGFYYAESPCSFVCSCAKKEEPTPFSSFRLLSFSPLSGFYFLPGALGVAALSHYTAVCMYT